MNKNMLLFFLVLVGCKFFAYAEENMTTTPDLDIFFNEMKKQINSNEVVCFAYPVDEKKVQLKSEVVLQLVDLLQSKCEGIGEAKSPSTNSNAMSVSDLPIPDATVDFMKNDVHLCQLLLFINERKQTCFITLNLIGYRQLSLDKFDDILPVILSIVTDVDKKYPWLWPAQK